LTERAGEGGQKEQQDERYDFLVGVQYSRLAGTLSHELIPTERSHETAIEAGPDNDTAALPLAQLIGGWTSVEAAAGTGAQPLLDNSVDHNRDFSRVKCLLR
jgi:hypothetical protein